MLGRGRIESGQQPGKGRAEPAAAAALEFASRILAVPFSQRKRRIPELTTQGYGDREIGDRLRLGEWTVQPHPCAS